MKRRIFILLIFLACATVGYSYQTTKTLSLPAQGISDLKIDCGAGFLKVEGSESLDKIEVEAEIILQGRSERRAEDYIRKNIKLDLKKQENSAVLVSHINQRPWMFSFRSQVINLTVHVPSDIDLNIKDGSGSISVTDINGRLEVDDGSGEIRINSIGGSLRVEDGSGALDVQDISGDVWIDDGSGSIKVRQIGQNVTVSDGSGSILIDGVGGDVVIRDDGSGSLRIQNVKGKVHK